MFNALYKNSQLKWNVKGPNGTVVIPYIITGRYDSSEKKAISEAMRRIEKNTCIRFKQRTTERDYVDLQNERGEGCYTNVGRVGGRGVVMLEANQMETCMEPEIVQHELMHVIGLWHEHMRADRDQYIKVNYNNIPPNYWSQFEKVTPYEATTYDVPYDYKSVMHYGKNAFAKPGRISMETKDPRYQNIIGHAKDASPNDYKKICKIYGCEKCMGSGGDKETSDKEIPDVEIPDEVTEKPILPPVHGRCVDRLGRFCHTMLRNGMLECSFIGKYQCCRSCMIKEQEDRRGGGWSDPFGMFGDLFGFTRRFRF
ncbi:unnamed protein product [Heligmosomoides polygyrus]|uniref:Metalloendopeptidase n=1 Tax=Heligmosomoides polygyrus TaxID=6339 RepID=A0A183FQE3_HELPZ|nr:unnamed protein product [Heligmosomoides polygyrus]